MGETARFRTFAKFRAVDSGGTVNRAVAVEARLQTCPTTAGRRYVRELTSVGVSAISGRPGDQFSVRLAADQSKLFNRGRRGIGHGS